jgi:hypothetical protein
MLFYRSEEYQNRYKRGMLFYLRDETVVGMLFWNFPPIEDRKEVATEVGLSLSIPIIILLLHISYLLV